MGTPETLLEAVKQTPEQSLQLLHSTLHYKNVDLKVLKDTYDQSKTESSQRQEQLEATVNDQNTTMTDYQEQINEPTWNPSPNMASQNKTLDRMLSAFSEFEMFAAFSEFESQHYENPCERANAIALSGEKV